MNALPCLLMSSVIAAAIGCGKPDAAATSARRPPPARLQSDPHFYKLNSVMGTVVSNGKPVAGATITVAKAKVTFQVEPTGSYVIELDPKQFGGLSHMLVYSAPGFQDETRHVLIRENNQIRVDVELSAKESL